MLEWQGHIAKTPPPAGLLTFEHVTVLFLLNHGIFAQCRPSNPELSQISPSLKSRLKGRYSGVENSA